MSVDRRVIRIADVLGFSMRGHEESYSSRLIIDAESVGSQRLIVNHFTLKAGHSTEAGQHPCPYDEVYCVLQGRGRLTLGNDDVTAYELEPGMVAFIPCETVHTLHNPGCEELVVLTIMPQQPRPGVNPVYDARLQAWGTSFRLVDGATDISGNRPNSRGAPVEQHAEDRVS